MKKNQGKNQAKKQRKFRVGNRVCWTSHANGNWTHKVGRVVRVVTSRSDLSERSIELGEFKGYKIKFSSDDINPRNNGRAYLIEVKDNRSSQPRLYMPLVQYLQPA